MYVYLKKDGARYNPGTVTGKGQSVSGIWLESAGKDLGVPIPSHIADKLRGRTFNRFDDFRAALWGEIGKDPNLINQFNEGNEELLRKERSPYTVDSEQSGGRKVFEIHHVKEIQHGGAVYNIDNLRIVTPKNHIRIHKK
ncbi:HNH endonuclease signature motif containing protein [Xenorhabdus khoisanae]|uniref:HNH endonuclease signature motif containing protein n=1 Tax=Xenorhabdus khoisanae TaxID=880157 RepID=UPI002D1E38B9|nr:HNH endonuclease signature motif containing protein [Xenorhabdus khoisanae]